MMSALLADSSVEQTCVLTRGALYDARCYAISTNAKFSPFQSQTASQRVHCSLGCTCMRLDVG